MYCWCYFYISFCDLGFVLLCFYSHFFVCTIVAVSAVPDAPADCTVNTVTYNQSSGMLLLINIIWDTVKVSNIL